MAHGPPPGGVLFMSKTLVNNVSWRIGGQQGEGIDSTGDIFAKSIARMGLHLYTYRSFSSRIRGGLTFFEVRVSEKPVQSEVASRIVTSSAPRWRANQRW